MLLVVGGSGQLGTAIVRKGRERGMTVRAMVRPTSEHAHLRGAEAEIVFGDLKDLASLRAACDNVSAVISTATVVFPRGRYSFEADEGQGYANLLRACRERGVSQFVFPSILPFPDGYTRAVPTLRMKRHVERLAEQSGVSYTIFRAVQFMDDYFAVIGSEIPLRGAEAATLRRPFWFSRALLSLIGDSIEKRGVAFLPGRPEMRQSFISVDDVAEFCLRAVGHVAARNRYFDIGGPPTTWREVLDIYADLLGRPVRAVVWPSWLARAGARALRPFSPAVANQMGILWVIGENEVLVDWRKAAESFGVEVTTPEAFLREKFALPA